MTKQLLSVFTKLFIYKVNRWVLSFMALTGLSVFSTYEIQKLSIESTYAYNLFDVLFYEFGLFTNVFLIIFPVYIYFISDLFLDKSMDNFIYFRVNEKITIWKAKIMLIFLLTIFYMALATFITFIVGGLTFGFANEWSEGAVKINSVFSQEEFRYISTDFLTLNPYISTLILITLLTLSLFSLGVLLNIITIFLKKTIITYSAGLLLNFSMLICFKFNHSIEFNLLPYQHFLLIFRNISKVSNPNSFAFSILYWCLLIGIILIFSMLIFKRSDYIVEVKDND